MKLLDPVSFGPDFHVGTPAMRGISVVKLGFLLNWRPHSLWFKMSSCELRKL